MEPSGRAHIQPGRDTMTHPEPLAERHCSPCHGETPLATDSERQQWLAELQDWSIGGDHHLVRKFGFPDFLLALAHVQQIGELAEQLGHHPDLALGWGRVEVKIFTHAVDGLTELDFILAARIDQLSGSK